mgnify:CR=1 FL=1
MYVKKYVIPAQAGIYTGLVSRCPGCIIYMVSSRFTLVSSTYGFRLSPE